METFCLKLPESHVLALICSLRGRCYALIGVYGFDPGSLTEGLNSLSIICRNSGGSVGTSRRGISRFAVSTVGVGFWGEHSVSVVMS